VIEDYGPHEASLLHSWQKMWWFDDRGQFENASMTRLREHFKDTWYTGLSSEDRSTIYPEHYMFLVVDNEVLASVSPHSTDISSHSGEFPFVKCIDANPPVKGGGYPEQGEGQGQWEGQGQGEKQGEKQGERYTGYMKVRIPSLFSLYGAAMDAEVQSMRAVCPRSSEWFSRHLVWVEDDNWLEEEGEGEEEGEEEGGCE
jgi:hypothetical protein